VIDPKLPLPGLLVEVNAMEEVEGNPLGLVLP
jgi:hypothetical protein